MYNLQGVCEKRNKKSKSGSLQYEVLVESWATLPNKENKERQENRVQDKENEYSDRADTTRFGAHDIRYPPTEPRVSVAVRNEQCRPAPEDRCRTVTAADNRVCTEIAVTRTFSSQPHPLVPVENRYTVFNLFHNIT